MAPTQPEAQPHFTPPENGGEFKTQSDSISKIALALSKAQAEMTSAKRTATNPFFNSSYADLSSVWDSIRIPLSKQELAVVQTPIEDERGTAIITTLAHSSGEWFRSKLYITPKARDAQSVGSAITYARRYALSAITGIAPDDDDGQKAVGQNGKDDPARRPAPARSAASPQNRAPQPATPPPAAAPAKATPAAPPTAAPASAPVAAATDPLAFPPPNPKAPRKVIRVFLDGVTNKTYGAGSEFYKLNGTEGETWTTFSKTIAERAREYASKGTEVLVALDMQTKGAVAVGIRPA